MRVLFSCILLIFAFQAVSQPWFKDNFDNNNNGWHVSQSDMMDYVLENGTYKLINKDSRNYIYWMYKNLYMNPSKDFTMQVSLRFTDLPGDGLGGFFIMDRNKNMNMFTVNPSKKYFWIGYSLDGKWGSFSRTDVGVNSGWQLTEAFLKPNEYQTLKIVKNGTTIDFYINTTKVLTLKSSEFASDIHKNIGFITSGKMTMEIDYVEFYQDNFKDVLSPSSLPLKASPLPRAINTYADELNAILTADLKTLYFTRIHYKENYNYLGENSQKHDGDIYYSEYINGAWTNAKRLEFGISNKDNNAIASVSPDGNTLLLFGTYDRSTSSCDADNGLSVSYRTADGWSYPESLNIKNFYSAPGAKNYFMADNGMTLILCVNRNDSKGAADLYVSFKQPDNSWSEPKHMGYNLCTSDTEFSPFLSADNKTLYYASWKLPGYGEADMYMTRRLDDSWTKWSDPINLGPAINDQNFNAYYKMSTDGKVIYYSSNTNSLGYSDIVMSDLPKELRPDPVTVLKGFVLDAKTKKTLGVTLYYEDLQTGKIVGECRSNPLDGSYSINLPFGKEYGIHASLNHYIALNENMNLKSTGDYSVQEKNIYMVPVEIGQVVNLNNVFFVRSKADLIPTSFPELDRLCKLLLENPTIKIELRGHTDNQGNPQINITLSEERVKTVTDYLIKCGVNKNRIQGKGYGGSTPVAPNDTEENRQRNRRVEFVIVQN